MLPVLFTSKLIPITGRLPGPLLSLYLKNMIQKNYGTMLTNLIPLFLLDKDNFSVNTHCFKVFSGSISELRIPFSGLMVVIMHLVHSLTFLNTALPTLTHSQESSAQGWRFGPSTTKFGRKFSTVALELPILLFKSLTDAWFTKRILVKSEYKP